MKDLLSKPVLYSLNFIHFQFKVSVQKILPDLKVVKMDSSYNMLSLLGSLACRETAGCCWRRQCGCSLKVLLIWEPFQWNFLEKLDIKHI